MVDTDEGFEWDDQKSADNRIKHGIDFRVAKLAFSDPNILSFDSYWEGGELRYDAIGKVTESSYLRVTYTIRGTDDIERYRIISARKADRKERGIYDEKVYGQS